MGEHELAQKLGVSRSTVREPINKLVSMNLLDRREGHETFVNVPAPSAEENPLAAVINGE